MIEDDLEKLNFKNCIIYGSLENEIVLDTADNSQALFNYTFDHCLLKTTKDFGSHEIECIRNVEPSFFMPEDPEDAIDDDFRLNADSPCIDAGNSTISTPLDFNMVMRDGSPDIGAYEFAP